MLVNKELRGDAILDGKTFVAIGARLEEGKVRRESVEEARAALMHEFTTWIWDYPWWRCGSRIERWKEIIVDG